MERALIADPVRKKICVFLCSAMIFSGCADALPRSLPDQDLQSYYERANAAAERSRIFAEEARREREQAEELLKEVRELSQQTEETRAYCKELVGKIPKRRPRRIYRVPKKTEEEKKKEQEEKEGPKFSPSDAPLQP